MAQKKIVHIVGTGTIGEPLIGILSTFKEQFGIDEVTFHKRTPLLNDRSKVMVSCSKGAKLAVDKDRWQKFVDMGMTPSLEAEEAIERIYYSHQIGATRPFKEAVPRELLESKVRTYLKQSVVLEQFWSTPVTRCSRSSTSRTDSCMVSSSSYCGARSSNVSPY